MEKPILSVRSSQLQKNAKEMTDLIFSRRLGEVRPYREKLHPLEKRFLIDAHVNFRRQQNERGIATEDINWGQMDWSNITRQFNNTFHRRILAGEMVERPARTEGGLRSARPRIPEIVTMTGMPPRDDKRKGGKKQGGGKEEKNGGKEGDDKDEGGKK